MADISGWVGRSGEPFEMVVERGKVREFALATGPPVPGTAAGGPTVRAPVTFLQTQLLWSEPDSSPWPGPRPGLARLLHGAQEFVFHRPPPAVGDVLVARQRIDAAYTKQGRRGGLMTFAEVVTVFTDRAGVAVAESRSTLIWTAGAGRAQEDSAP